MNLLQKFKQENHRLFNEESALLLAISGGIDSMVMLDLCLRNNLNFAIAHCNFGLRNEESERDEQFVLNISNQFGIKCHIQKFDTKKSAKECKLSIQETARNLRYNYFQDLINQYGYKFVLTAHHQNDNVETFFINLLRGTGIKGLAGINQQRRNIYRPLLCISRKDIEKYAIENSIEFIEDSSNKKDEYLRNNIRHHLIPSLQSIHENAIEKISDNSKVIRLESNMLEWFYKDWFVKNKIETESGFKIECDKLFELPSPTLLLKHVLKQDNVDIFELDKFLRSNTGSIIRTSEFEVLKNRDEIIFRKIGITKNTDDVVIDFLDSKCVHLNFKMFANHSLLEIEKKSDIAYLDFDLVKFPLKLRNWKHGDTFYPFGMKNKKLVSDFLINNKVSVFEKENVKVLTSNNQVLWVVGIRIDNRFAITSQTKSVLKIMHNV